jgi:hypothetical protein
MCPTKIAVFKAITKPEKQTSLAAITWTNEKHGIALEFFLPPPAKEDKEPSESDKYGQEHLLLHTLTTVCTG